MNKFKFPNIKWTAEKEIGARGFVGKLHETGLLSGQDITLVFSYLNEFINEMKEENE